MRWCNRAIILLHNIFVYNNNEARNNGQWADKESVGIPDKKGMYKCSIHCPIFFGYFIIGLQAVCEVSLLFISTQLGC